MSTSPRVWIACHGPLGCNSGLHVRALASGLGASGFSVRVLVPERDSEDEALGAGLILSTFDEAVHLVSTETPDLIHFWTARERMVRLERRLALRAPREIPHLVHLEDDEDLLVRQQMGLSDEVFLATRRGSLALEVPEHLTHPRHGLALLEGSAGVTALNEALAARAPAGVPSTVFWPGFDPAFDRDDPTAAAEVRSLLGIDPETLIVTYTGNVHDSNVEEVRSLYLAVALANRMGCAMRLIRTGVDFVPLAEHGEDLLRANAHELGRVDRDLLPRLVHAADFLVQPGRIDDWNRLRVPSKLPDFLVSGRAVVLPRVNLGEHLTPGVDALVLESAAAEDLLACFLEWAHRPEERREIGAAGARFARNHLTWEAAADAVSTRYRAILDRDPSTPHADASVASGVCA